MKKFAFMMISFLITVLLIGCDDKLEEIKEAASGIDNQADKAAKAISLDAHTIRAIEIHYENYSFTINELFKTILRDTQWEYEQNEPNHVLLVKGAWKEPLFENYDLALDKKQLVEEGKVYIELFFEEDKLIEEETKVVLKFDKEVVFEKRGKEVLNDLYNSYIQTINKK